MDANIVDKCLETIKITAIHVRGKGGTLVASSVREAAILSLVKDCRVVLYSRGETHTFDPENLINSITSKFEKEDGEHSGEPV